MSNMVKQKKSKCSCCGGIARIRREEKVKDGVTCHRCLLSLQNLSEPLVYQMSLTRRFGLSGEVGELILVKGMYYVGRRQPSNASMVKNASLF